MPVVVFLTDEPVAADRAVALARNVPVPAVKEMVRDVEGREPGETGQNGETCDFASFHESLLFSTAARRQSPTSIRSILKMTGLVPSLQQAIMTRSSFVQPCMMAPPCSAA